MSNIIQLKQERIPRAVGWQLAQWISRVPIGATTPDVLEPLFVIRVVGGRESFDRVASLPDFVNYSENRLIFFEPRGTNGGAVLRQATNGDTLRFPAASLIHWEQTDAPYNTRNFQVYQVTTRHSGSGADLFAGGGLLVAGYSFTEADIGRWILLTGFASPSYNGYAQITGVVGGVAQTHLSVPSDVSSNDVWEFRWIQLDPGTDPALEPRYFPERRDALQWELWRGLTQVTAGNGGSTRREREDEVFLSVRWTSIEASLDAALSFMTSVQSGVSALQTDAARNDGAVGEVVTTTFGP